MDPDALAVAFALVVGQVIVLHVISRRLVLGVVVKALAARSSGRAGRLLLLFLRLPGNLLHEWSHAAGYVLSGYRIEDIASCLSDRRGRGYCKPGPPWSPLHSMPLAAAVASALPLFVGALAIRTLGGWLGVHLPEADLIDEGLGPVAARFWPDLAGFALGLDWQAWQTYLFWYLALSIGAELAPSDVDLRRGGLVLCILAALLVIFIYAVPHMDLRPGTAAALYGGLWGLLRTLSAALFAGFVGGGLVGIAAALVAVAIGGDGR